MDKCPSFTNSASLLNAHRENTALQINANAAVFNMQISHVNSPNHLFFGLVMPYYQFAWIFREEKPTLKILTATFGCIFCRQLC